MAGGFSLNFELKSVTIQTIPGTNWDITFLLNEINIYEDIYNSTISADFVINDAENQINNFPITGHEWLSITYRTPGRAWVTLKLRIYKVSERQLEKERHQLYILHCVDNVDFTNAKTRISKAYKGMLISDIANDIQTSYLNSSFDDIEETDNIFHILPRYWSPIHTMNFLAARATSASYNGANYFYFQTVDGFNFISGESLCSELPVKNYVSQPANVRKQDVAVGYKPPTYKLDEVAIQSYKIVTTFDTLENVSRGMYGSKVIWHDIRKQLWGESDFDYSSSYDDYVHVEPNNVTGGKSYLWTSKSDFTSAFGALKHYSIGQPEAPSHVLQWLSQRISQQQQIQNVRLHVTVPGDSDRRAGDIVTVALPSPEPLINNQVVYDKYYRDRYMVTGIRHKINKQSYETILELVKDSIFTAFP